MFVVMFCIGSIVGIYSDLYACDVLLQIWGGIHMHVIYHYKYEVISWMTPKDVPKGLMGHWSGPAPHLQQALITRPMLTKHTAASNSEIIKRSAQLGCVNYKLHNNCRL